MGTIVAKYSTDAFKGEHDPVRATTLGPLPVCDYAAGPPATLTENPVAAALAAQDGVTLAVGERLLVKDQAAKLQNGVYKVTALGDGALVPWVLTRDVDYDASEKVHDGDSVKVVEGTLYADTEWRQTTPNPISLGTSELVFASFEESSGLAAHGYVQTTDATETTALARTIPDGQCRTVLARVTGRKADGTVVGGYLLHGTFRAAGGAVTQVGATAQVDVNEDDAAYNATMDASAATYRVRVTGKGGDTVDWDVNVQETVGFAR